MMSAELAVFTESIPGKLIFTYAGMCALMISLFTAFRTSDIHSSPTSAPTVMFFVTTKTRNRRVDFSIAPTSVACSSRPSKGDKMCEAMASNTNFHRSCSPGAVSDMSSSATFVATGFWASSPAERFLPRFGSDFACVAALAFALPASLDFLDLNTFAPFMGNVSSAKRWTTFVLLSRCPGQVASIDCSFTGMAILKSSKPTILKKSASMEPG